MAGAGGETRQAPKARLGLVWRRRLVVAGARRRAAQRVPDAAAIPRHHAQDREREGSRRSAAHARAGHAVLHQHAPAHQQAGPGLLPRCAPANIASLSPCHHAHCTTSWPCPGGVRYFPVDRNTFLSLQSFFHLAQQDFPSVRFGICLYQDLLVWSSLPNAIDINALYTYLVLHVMDEVHICARDRHASGTHSPGPAPCSGARVLCIGCSGLLHTRPGACGLSR